LPEIELRKIQPNRLNPRLEFTKAGLDELADSIRQVGLIEPIIVRPKVDGYEVVVGERRYRAAQQAGLERVPVMVRDYTDQEVMELNLIENIQREDLSAVEKAKICQQLRDRFTDRYPTWASIAERIGVDESAVRNWVRTLGLPEEMQAIIAPKEFQRVPPGKVDFMTVLRITKTVPDTERQVEIAREFARQQVSSREAGKMLKEVVREPEKPVQEVVRQVREEAPIYLPFSKAHADAIIERVKTQTSRKSKDPHIRPGAIVRAAITHFADLRVIDVRRKQLGDFDESDAQREGGYTLEEFKEVWKELHGEWNPQETVYVIEFELAEVI
jgi:ParB family chromosome partitioning protein